MIVFHEGLPGSGKSYEAAVMHILPTLKRGRRVVTNIEGINHAKFAELSGLPQNIVEMLLVCIYGPDDLGVDERIQYQKQQILEQSGKDALIIIDEIQNLFPSERNKLDPDWSRYITEHRHDGLDIVLMGQDRRDCHAMWRRRIQRVITFNKLVAVGKPNSYRWECLEATRPEKYNRTSSGIRKYESQYFGLYKSHTEGTKNTDVYADERANVLNNKSLRFGVPAFVFAVGYAVFHLVGFFSPEVEASAVKVVDAPQYPPGFVPHEPQRIELVRVVEESHEIPGEPIEPPPIDLFDDYAKKHRLRLSGVVAGETKLVGYVDVLSNTFHKQDRFTIEALRDMGWTVTLHSYGLSVKQGEIEHIVRPWPIDKYGQVDKETREAL